MGSFRILSKIAVEESKIQTSRSQLENQDNLSVQNSQQIVQNQNFSQSFQNTPAPEPDPKAQAWAEKNFLFLFHFRIIALFIVFVNQILNF